jgi:hypothetical protein
MSSYDEKLPCLKYLLMMKWDKKMMNMNKIKEIVKQFLLQALDAKEIGEEIKAIDQIYWQSRMGTEGLRR